MTASSPSKKVFLSPQGVFIISIFVASFFGWIFAEIAEEIWIEKELFPLDQAISAWMAKSQTPFELSLFRLLTFLGGIKWLTGLTLGTSALLFIQRRRLEGFMLLGGMGITVISVLGIKYMSARPRPPSEFSLLENTMAFPSGHMALSLFFYGFLAYIISRHILQSRYAVLPMAFAVFLAVMIGISRLYLNVHWLTDILAGFALAAAYLSLCIGYMEMHKK